MGFKSDREFLRNITIGAVGTRQVARLLRQGGFQIIELERTATSNKIWMTKVKRLRVPDLLCLRTGIRIESRAKSDLKIAMSHAVKNEERAWDRGLWDDDLVAFIRCTEREDGGWVPGDRAALFRVRNMRATVEAAGLTRMKAASEGSEIQLVWPATVPQQPGRVSVVTQEAIDTVLESGRRQRYRLTVRRGGDGGTASYCLHPYVVPGDGFGAGDTIIASVVPECVRPVCPPSGQYDFIPDLRSESRETVYAAAKALGFLPEAQRRGTDELRGVAADHPDALVRLESAAALARLGIPDGWEAIEHTLRAAPEVSLRMEAVLILGELRADEALRLLAHVASDRSNPPELRAAAAWGMSTAATSLDATPLLELLADDNEVVAIHALVSASRLMDVEGPALALVQLGTDDRASAGIVRAILALRCDPLPQIITAVQNAIGPRRSWLLYLLGMLGRARCERHLSEHAPEILRELELFWTRHIENWTNRLDIADQIDFQIAQMLD